MPFIPHGIGIEEEERHFRGDSAPWSDNLLSGCLENVGEYCLYCFQHSQEELK